LAIPTFVAVASTSLLITIITGIWCDIGSKNESGKDVEGSSQMGAGRTGKLTSCSFFLLDNLLRAGLPAGFSD
jgi:hypothetical protein